MGTTRLGRGEWLAGGAGLALLAVMFLPWFGTAPEENPFAPPARKVTVDAWRSFEAIDLVLVLTVAAAIAFAVLAARGHEPLRVAQARVAAMGLSILAAILICYRMIEPLENTTLRLGIVLGLLAVLAILAGAQLSLLDDRAAAARQRGR